MTGERNSAQKRKGSWARSHRKLEARHSLFHNFICLLTAMLGLLCRLSSSCGSRRLLSSRGARASNCGSVSCCRAQALGCVGLRSCGSQAREHGLNSCDPEGLSGSLACGIFLDQGLNQSLLHWQANSLPLSHQGNPEAHLSMSS